MSESGEWRPDPDVPGRQRFWDDGWTSHVSVGGETSTETYLGGAPRWQYGAINIGMFGAMERMQQVFATLGAEGWELVTVYDKASNWFADMEKGFMLFKRPVPPGQTVPDDQWCIALRL